MIRDWKRLILYLLFAGFIVILILFIKKITPLAPVKEVKKARVSISAAKKNKADTYSKKLFSEALVCYDSAMINWKRENKRFILFRNFDKTAEFAELASRKAIQASENTIFSSNSLKVKLKPKIDSLIKVITDLNNIFTGFPLPTEIRTRISKGKLELKEGEIAYKNGQYLSANEKISDAEYLISGSYDNAMNRLETYFKSYPEWKRWMEKTINESQQKSISSIIVDKFSRKCYIYENGTKKYEFEVELGKNWIGDKQRKGDRATPEGMYNIVDKINGNKTKYYKALLLNYPNEEDLVNFNLEKSKGRIPASAKIGGMIEIHGNGGKGTDWTEGCIALRDKDMDVVFNLTDEGTPVTIIGSVNDLDYILRR
jgi:uncharacterized protein YlxP (DUF503 family)